MLICSGESVGHLNQHITAKSKNEFHFWTLHHRVLMLGLVSFPVRETHTVAAAYVE